MAIEAVPLVAAGTVTAVGVADIVKFGSAVTFNANVVVVVMVPPVAVMVTVAAPTVAVSDATKVRVAPADPVTEDGLNVAVTPVGRPLTLKLMGLVKPLIEDTVTLSVAVVPCSTVTPGAETVKLGAVVAGMGGNAFCTSVVNSVVQKVPAGGEFGIAPVSMLFASALLCAGSQFGSPVVEVTPLNTLPG